MNLEFTSEEEIYKRVKPALQSKLDELERLNYYNIRLEDIWNYLKKEKWSKGDNLSLSDIVNDILTMDNDCFYNNKIKEVSHEEK